MMALPLFAQTPSFDVWHAASAFIALLAFLASIIGSVTAYNRAVSKSAADAGKREGEESAAWKSLKEEFSEFKTDMKANVKELFTKIEQLLTTGHLHCLQEGRISSMETQIQANTARLDRVQLVELDLQKTQLDILKLLAKMGISGNNEEDDE